MSELLLHHYDLSPYAHKVRLIFGLKGLDWRSVEIPLIMPKPDLMPLTGGFRRTPVLQIGADIYCDTERIAVELERRHPEPSLFPAGGQGLSTMIGTWAADVLFRPAMNFAFSNIADKLPEGLLEDRAAMRGAPPPDVAQFMALAPRFGAELHPLLGTVESLLEDGRAFVTGDRPALADMSLYHPLWTFNDSGRKVRAALEPFPRVVAWMERMAAIGQGGRSEMPPAEALDIAAAAEPAPLPGEPVPDAASPKVGQTVSVMSADKAPEPVVGELIYVAENEVTVRRDDPRVGIVHQHFPRAGYVVRKTDKA